MSDPSKKPFRLRAEEIKPLAEGHGGCMATDMITCEGRKVAFMYREEPEFDDDSGWRFTSGYESDDYLNDADHLGMYDCNTIANYDPEIVPLLDAPVGSAFERVEGIGPLREVHDFEPPTD